VKQLALELAGSLVVGLTIALVAGASVASREERVVGAGGVSQPR
jgi:hypothetical protein